MVMYANAFETKEKLKITEIKNKQQQVPMLLVWISKPVVS